MRGLRKGCRSLYNALALFVEGAFQVVVALAC